MKYKVGDKVRVKSLAWYNENKNKDGDVINEGFWFVPHMRHLLGAEAFVSSIEYYIGYKSYRLSISGVDTGFYISEYMLEDLIDEHCEYCDDEKSKVITTVEIPYYPDAEISIFQGKLTGGVCDVRVNYCPMCGRKLNNEQ